MIRLRFSTREFGIVSQSFSRSASGWALGGPLGPAGRLMLFGARLSAEATTTGLGNCEGLGLGLGEGNCQATKLGNLVQLVRCKPIHLDRLRVLGRNDFGQLVEDDLEFVGKLMTYRGLVTKPVGTTSMRPGSTAPFRTA
jgi:hypothetical protein